VLEYRGRADHQVKLRGHRIELGEIEAALARHPAVRDAVVLLRDDLAGPPGLVAYIVPRDADAPAADTLRGALRGRLPEYMLPAAFVVLDALPLLPSGKVDRAKLPPPDGRHAGPILVHPPQTETERGLAAIWCEALGLEQVSIHDNFFDIGGNSLVLMKVHALIARKHERDLSFVDLFEHTTIHALARLLDSGQAQTDDVPDTATRDARRQAGHQRLQARRARAQSSDTTTGSQL
jgi:aryl carrier-like protein